MIPLRSFVYAPMRLKGELIKRYDDDITPEPKPDMVIGDPELRVPFTEWGTDRYGNILQGPFGTSEQDYLIKGGGRFLYKLTDVTTVQYGGVWHVVLEPGICAQEACPWRKPIGLENLLVDLKDIGEAHVNLMRDHQVTLHEKEPTVFYAHSWDDNYYHRVMDTLPRLWAQEEELIPPGVTKWHHTNHHAVHYDTLYFPSFWPASGYAPEPIKWIRQHRKLKTERQKNTALYLSRADSPKRNVANEIEVIRLLMAMGLQVTRAMGKDLSFDQQIKLAGESQLIIGPHGAGLTNAIFANHAGVIELVPSGYQHVCFQYLSKWAGNWHGRLLCKGEEDTEMTVDLDALEAMVREAVKATG